VVKKVLIVDDHPPILALISANLKMAGLQTITASNGEEALTKMRDEQPDLVVLDIIMPVLDGWGTMQKMKDDSSISDIPVVIISVRTQNDDIIRGLHTGAEYYLPKPFYPTELVALVQRVLSAYEKKTQPV
jgi:DNA-binding response OmpR family regulator